MASLDGLFAKDNLLCLFQKVSVETNFPLKGSITHSFQITAKIIDCSYRFFNVRKRDVSQVHNLDYTVDYWISRS